MFGGMMSDKASTAKLLASGSASVDAVLGRLDLPDHISNNCNVGANLRYLLQFTEKNLPRILTAVQKPAGSVTPSAPPTLTSRFFDSNDPTSNASLLAARNASALLVKYCQCCTRQNGNNNALDSSPQPSPLGKVVPVMLGIFSRRGDLPDSVALDIQRVLLASVETDHETTLHNINITLRSDIASGVVRHLSTSMIVSETLVSLFGSALNAKAMMMEVNDPSAFVAKWVEHDFHLRLVNHLSSAMKNIDCAPYFFFFQEILKRAFSPNVGPMVDQILAEQCFGKLFDIAVSAAEDLLRVRRKGGNAHKSVSAAQTPRGDNEVSDTLNITAASDGETPPIASIGSYGRTTSGMSATTESGEEPEYPYLPEALNLVFQCIGIIRRSLPPPESEPIYMARRLPLSHGPVHVMLRFLPRLVNILRSAIPSEFRPTSHILRRHRNVVDKLRKNAIDSALNDDSASGTAVSKQKGAPLLSPTAEIGEDDDVVRVDEGEESDVASTTTASTTITNATSATKQHKSGGTTDPTLSATAAPPRTIFGAARLAITDIIVELTLFRSRVCDEALIASGAIEALLDCAEVFANHDLLLRNVHRVIMAVMQRPAYSEISLASNVTAAIAANEAAQKTMAQQQANGNNNTLHSGVNNNSNLSENLSFASSTFENGKDSHPSFFGMEDLRRQYSSSSLAADDDNDVCGFGYEHNITTIDDELLFHGKGKCIAPACVSTCEDHVGTSESTTAEGDTEDGTNGKTKGRRQRHPHLLPKCKREALEAEKLIERQILQRLDRETLAMIHIDPLVRFLVQRRPLTELLYAWASTPEPMSLEEQAMMPEGQKAFRDFGNTSLQVHATQILQRLREVGASQAVKNECAETLHCNDDISSKLALWQKPITGDRYTESHSGCSEVITHRPLVHRENDASIIDMDDEEHDFGLSSSNGAEENKEGTNFDFDAGNLISGRSSASNNDNQNGSGSSPSSSFSDSPEKRNLNRANTSTDDFQNEDVTGEAAPLISPRKRSNSMGREHRYAAAYEADEDIANTSGGLFTEDSSMLGFGIAPGILKDEPANVDGSALPSSSLLTTHHVDPYHSTEELESISTRPRSRNSAPPEPDTDIASREKVEAFDESAFETRILEDKSTSEQVEHVTPTAGSPASPPHYDRYIENIPEFEPRPSNDVTGFGTDDEDESLLVLPTRNRRASQYKSPSSISDNVDSVEPLPSTSEPHQNVIKNATPSSAASSKFKVTFTSGRALSQGTTPVVSTTRLNSDTPNNMANDDSFELDEDTIGSIEKARGVSVDSSVDSDTADMLFEGGGDCKIGQNEVKDEDGIEEFDQNKIYGTKTIENVDREENKSIKVQEEEEEEEDNEQIPYEDDLKASIDDL